MNLARKAAAFVLLAALDVGIAHDVVAQVAIRPKVLPALQSKNANSKDWAKDHAEIASLCNGGMMTTLPPLGGRVYDAILSVHLPAIGDGTGELRIAGNLMRNDMTFSKLGVTLVKNHVWTDLSTDMSIQKRKIISQDEQTTFTQSFIAKLNNVPVQKCATLPYDKDTSRLVTVYYVNHQPIIKTTAFEGIVAIDQQGRLAAFRGWEMNITPGICGSYERAATDVDGFKSEAMDLKDLLLPSMPSLPEDPQAKAEAKKNLAEANRHPSPVPPPCTP